MVCGAATNPGSRMQNRLNSLDWLRAIAVAAVVIGHSKGHYAPGGAVGVSVFFVLSGYLIADILLRDGILTLPNIGRFIIRRIGRIYPMYAVHIGAVTLLFLVANQENLTIFKPYLADLLTFRAPPGEWVGYGVAVLWTLYVEAWFYLTFPFILFAASLLPGARVPKYLAVFGFLFLAVNVLKLYDYREVSVIYYDLFLIGSACAVVVRSGVIPAVFARPGIALAGLLLIFAAIAKEYPGDRNIEWHLQSMAAAIGTAIFVLASFANPPKYRLEKVAFIGRISYSIYLVHALVLDIILMMFRKVGIFELPYLAIVVYISWKTYTYIEQPCIRFIHRLVPLIPNGGSNGR